MTLREIVAGKEEAITETLRELIAIRSVRGPAEEGAPFGAGPRRCLERTLEIAESLGLPCGDIDMQVGWCEIGSGEEMIGVLGHLDVVPEGEGWTTDPYGGEIRDGAIYGRGAVDDKGPSVAALYALASIRESGLPLRRRLRLIFGTNEETGGADMKHYTEHGGELPLMGFSPDAEFPVINGEKGIIHTAFVKKYVQEGDVRLLKLSGGSAPNIVPSSAHAEIACSDSEAERLLELAGGDVTAKRIDGGVCFDASGISAHGSMPEKGRNAIGALLKAVADVPLGGGADTAVRFLAERIGTETDGASLGIKQSDDVSGGLTVNMGMICGGEDRLEVRIDCRYPVTKDYSGCGPAMREAFESAGFEQTEQSHKRSVYVPADSELVRTLLSVYEEETGDAAEPKCIGGGTYAKAMPNIVAFGPVFPGGEVREHQPDECIEIENLMKNAQIIAQAMYRLAK